MPQIASLAEFNRNQTKMLEQLAETKQPIYLTRNGAKSVVVMDTEAFENSMLNRESLKEEELKIYQGLMRGMSDYVEGRTLTKDEFRRRVAEKNFEKNGSQV